MNCALAQSGDLSGPPLTVIFPDSPELLTFLKEVYATQNPDMVVGSWATLADYVTQVRTLQKFFNWERLERGETLRGITLADITKPLLSRAIAWLRQQGREATTCNKFRRSILAIYNFAIQECDLPGQAFKISKLPEIKREPRAWRPEQVGKLLAAARAMPGNVGPVPAGLWHYAHLMLLLNTGTRISAAMRTPTSHLDFGSAPPQVIVPGDVQKHKRDQVYDLLPDTVEALRAIQPQRNKLIFGDWPFDDWQRGKWRTLTKRLKSMLVTAGLFESIDQIPKRIELFHKLRRCFVTFITAKYGIQAAQQLCGHSTVEVTKRYEDKSQTGALPSCSNALADKIVWPKS